MAKFVDALFDEIIRKLESVFKALEKMIRGLQDTINGILSFAKKVLTWVIEKIESLLNKIYAAWDKLVDTYNKVIRVISAPKTLHERSLSWLSDVKVPMSNYATAIGTDHLLRSRHWGGDAGDAYRDSVADQSQAGSQMATVADKTSDILEQCAEAGNVLYAAILAAVIEFQVGAAAAAVESATVVGIPVALATILAVAVVAATAVATAINAFTAFSNSISGGNRGFVQAMTEYTFGSKWPSATKYNA